jgi:hypothetical protein
LILIISGILAPFRNENVMRAELDAGAAVDTKNRFPARRIEVDCANYAGFHAFAAGVAQLFLKPDSTALSREEGTCRAALGAGRVEACAAEHNHI